MGETRKVVLTNKERDMRTRATLFCLTVVSMVQPAMGQAKELPPPAKIRPVVNDYYGKKITDPYRYMEDLEDPEVKAWLKSQADYARSVLDAIPGRQSLIDKMGEFDKRNTVYVTQWKVTENDQYFYLKSTPEDEIAKLYHRDGYEGNETLLFDPKTSGPDASKNYVIVDFAPSDDGGKVAFGVASGGSENTILVVMDVEGKTLYPERIDRCWSPNPSWLPSGDAFLFARLRSGDVHDKDRAKDIKVYLHTVGADPETDREVFSRHRCPELDIKPGAELRVRYNKRSRHMFGIVPTADKRNTFYYAPTRELNGEEIEWKQLFRPEDEVYWFQTTETALYVLTFKDADKFKILKTPLNDPDLANAETVVPEDATAVLTRFSLADDALYYTLSKNGVEEKLYRLPFQTRQATALDLPFPAGSISLKTKGIKFNDVWVGLSGWTSDYRRFRYLASSDEFKLENLSTNPEYPEYADLIVEELMVPAHDGVKVPLSLIYKKGLQKNGENPLLLYGYGAYGWSVNPFFDPIFQLWTHENGVLAYAHVRGGAELGEQWHKTGVKTAKPNTWKDAISCVEYLIKEGYTSPGRIAINGASAGGIMVGRAMTERPDLFAAAIPEVGVMNPLRYEEAPIGHISTPDFGTVKDPIECMGLIEMDAYLHLKDGVAYPATLVTSGMNDPRVIAWQQAKFAARLQAANVSNRPILFRVDYEAGHGFGDTKTKAFEGFADVLSFALWQTGHPKYQVK